MPKRIGVAGAVGRSTWCGWHYWCVQAGKDYHDPITLQLSSAGGQSVVSPICWQNNTPRELLEECDTNPHWMWTASSCSNGPRCVLRRYFVAIEHELRGLQQLELAIAWFNEWTSWCLAAGAAWGDVPAPLSGHTFKFPQTMDENELITPNFRPVLQRSRDAWRRRTLKAVFHLEDSVVRMIYRGWGARRLRSCRGGLTHEAGVFQWCR